MLMNKRFPGEAELKTQLVVEVVGTDETIHAIASALIDLGLKQHSIERDFKDKSNHDYVDQSG